MIKDLPVAVNVDETQKIHLGVNGHAQSLRYGGR